MRIGGPVVVATDLSGSADEALRQGDDFARAAGVPLEVCHVLPEFLSLDPLFPQLKLQDAIDAPEVERRAGEALEARMREVLGRAPGSYEARIATGSAHAGVLDEAERAGAGLLVLGAHGGGKGGALGGVAERVVRHASCPVLVARPSPRGKVLGASDFSDPALPAVEAAIFEAGRRGVGVVIIHCMDLLPPLGVIGYEVPPVSAEVIAALREQWEGRLRGSLERFGAQGEFLLEEGAAGPIIARTAAELPAELVVVGTHGRTGLKRLVLGSVAEAVVRNAPCSVLVVRLAKA